LLLLYYICYLVCLVILRLYELLYCSGGLFYGESPLKRTSPASQSAKVNLSEQMENVATQTSPDTWPLNRRIPINGYEVAQALHDNHFSTLDFWKMPVELLLNLDKLCESILGSLRTELASAKVNLNNQGVVCWSRAIIELLPNFAVSECVPFERCISFNEDASYKHFKKAYYAYVHEWNWNECHVPWVFGDGACLFNSVIALMTGRGVVNCASTAEHKYVVGSKTLRLACLCREIAALPYISTFSTSNVDIVQGRLASRCSISYYCGDEEVAALALLLRKPVQLMSPRWQQQFATYGLFSSGCEHIDNCGNPITIMWCSYVGGNSIASAKCLHNPQLRYTDLNHFIPCFVRPNVRIVRMKYLSNVKWIITEMPVSGVWKCPFFVLPLASSVFVYSDVQCPPTYTIGRSEVDLELPRTSLVFRAVWDEMSWEELVNEHSTNMNNSPSQQPSKKCSIVGVGGNAGAGANVGDSFSGEVPKIISVGTGVDASAARAGVNVSSDKVPVAMDKYFVQFVARPELAVHVNQYFNDTCAKVLYKFVNVRDVNMKVVNDIICALPNDVYEVSSEDVAKFCYYWLGCRRVHVIYKLTNVLQHGMRSWANLSVSMTKNINSTSYKKMCVSLVPNIPVSVVKHYASKILQSWCKDRKILNVDYVSPKWLPEHQHILDEYLREIQFDSARRNIADVTFNENALPLYKLYGCGMNICTIKEQVSMLCCKWSIDMTLKAHELFILYHGNASVINVTMLDMQASGFCNVRKQEVSRKYKAWVSHLHVQEESPYPEDKPEENLELPRVAADFTMYVKSELPLHVCKICSEMWFKDEIGRIEGGNLLCVRCLRSIENGNVAAFGDDNSCMLPVAYDLPRLTNIESKIVALQIPYMNVVQLFPWKGGYQVAMRGNVINIPNNVSDVVNTLPRLPDQMMDATLFVSLYKNVNSGFSYWSANVRPKVVHSYLSRLCTTPLYIEQKVKYDSERNVSAMKDIDAHVCQVDDDNNREVDDDNNTKAVEEADAENVKWKGKFYDPYGSKLCNDFVLNEYWSADKVQRLSSVHMKLEPCVNQAFVSMLRDHNSAEKCFPNIFMGEIYFQKQRSQYVTVDKLHKHLLCLYDDRARCDAEYVFFAMQQIQLKLAMNSIGLRMRKHQGLDDMCASQVLQESSVDRLVKNDVAFRDLEKVVGSPDELGTCKKNYRAMLRQLGHFQIFLTITSGEMYDKDVIIQLMEHDKYNHELYDGRSYANLYNILFDGNASQRAELKQICRDLSRKHSVLMVRLYHRKKAFIFDKVLPCILPNLQDYIANDEFGAKGLPHTHACLQLSDFPMYVTGCDVEHKQKVIAAIDKLCTCSIEGITEHQRNVQTHSHVNCMRDGSCRHRFPKYPMPYTDILEPLNACLLIGDAGSIVARNLNKINLLLKSLWRRSNLHDFQMPFNALLAHLDITFVEYINAIRSTLKGPTVMLRRRVCEIKMNTYCKELLEMVDCNMDMQFIIDPYVVIEYICNYITKGPHGISELMKKLMEEAKVNNMNVSQYIIKKANLFFNRREVCLYQACCVVLDLPMRLCTRKFVYLPTCEIKDRVHVVKKKDILVELDPNDKNILCKNELQKYSGRPVNYEQYYCVDFVANYTVYTKNGQMKVSKCNIPRIVRFRGYRESKDSENYYREQLLLYTSWRDECVDLIGDYASYKAAYVAQQKEIEERYKLYNKLHASRIDEIMSRVEARTEEVVGIVMPNIVTDDVDQFTLIPLQFKNEVYKGLQDAGQLLPDKEFQQCVRNLTYKQRVFYEHIKMSLLKPNQMLLFLTGGAGVGKSVVLLAIAQMLMRHFRLKLKVGVQDSDKPTVLIMSYTGNAAFNVSGNTVHSVFRINVNESQYRDLTANVLCTMKAKYGNVRVIIIDEISMLSAEMLYVIHMRLCQIFGNDDWFAGVHVIVVGDFFQLKPVAGSWAFQRPSIKIVGAGASLFDAWQHFKMYELRDVLRTDDLDWIVCLNRVREGQHTAEDVVMIKERVVEFPSGLEDIICARHVDLDEANKIFFNSFPGVPVYIKSKDKLSMHGIEMGIDINHATIISDMHPKHKQFLQDNLALKMNLPVELRHNFDTTDGLTNGAEGVVSSIERDVNGDVCKVNITFKDVKRGRKDRKLHNKKHYSVLKVMKNFELKKGTRGIGVHCVREQIPIGCSHARTFHRVQGLSLQRYGIVFGPAGSIPKHMVYVGLSRGRKYKGIFIKDFSEKHIKVDEDVVKEMARLRDNCQLQIQSELTRDITDSSVFVISHNARAFNVQNYKSLPDFENVDVLFCMEVRKQYVVEEILSGRKKLKLAISNLERYKGQAMFVNAEWPTQHVQHVNDCNVDVLYCTFTTDSGFSLTIVGVYKHIQHSTTSMSKLLDIIYANMPLECLCCHHLYITGDFNIQTNLLNRISLSNFSLYEVASHTPTTISNTKIDYMFTTDNTLQEHDNVVIPCDWSDHHILFCKIPQMQHVSTSHFTMVQEIHSVPRNILSKMDNILMFIKKSYAVEYNVLWSAVGSFPSQFPFIQFDMCTTLRQKWVFVVHHKLYSDIVWFDNDTCHYIRLLSISDEVHNNDNLSVQKCEVIIDFFSSQHFAMPCCATYVHVPIVALPLITGYYVQRICLTNATTTCQPLTFLKWAPILTRLLDGIRVQVP
jgi:DNA replication protein DnaC